MAERHPWYTSPPHHLHGVHAAQWPLHSSDTPPQRSVHAVSTPRQRRPHAASTLPPRCPHAAVTPPPRCCTQLQRGLHAASTPPSHRLNATPTPPSRRPHADPMLPTRRSHAASTPLHSAATQRPRRVTRVHAASTPSTQFPRSLYAAPTLSATPPGWGWAGWDAGGPGGDSEGVVRTFIQAERVFVWLSKERAPKPGRIGNLEKRFSGLDSLTLEKSCHDMEKSGEMLEEKKPMVSNNCVTVFLHRGVGWLAYLYSEAFGAVPKFVFMSVCFETHRHAWRVATNLNAFKILKPQSQSISTRTSTRPDI